MDDATNGANGDAVAPTTGTAARSEAAATELDTTPDAQADADPAEHGSSHTTVTRKRRRGSRGGRSRKKPGGSGVEDDTSVEDDDEPAADEPAAGAVETRPSEPAPRPNGQIPRPRPTIVADDQPELPERLREGRPSPEAAERALVRKPQIGDTRPAPPMPPTKPAGPGGARARGIVKPGGGRSVGDTGDAAKKKRRRSGKSRGVVTSPHGAVAAIDPEIFELRRGRERKGRPVGRYLMCVQVRPQLTQVAILEGRTLVELYVSRPADDISQIHGNIYVGKVQNVLPGMEAAFVDIGTPKNAVLYRGDVQYDPEDIVERGSSGQPRIEQMIRAKQLLICQVTKNPIGAKGARLTQEVSLPGRFVVLIPNSKTYGISKRLPDDVRKRLRTILDRVKPEQHGLIVRTAAEHATEHELRADMSRLLEQWAAIEAKAAKVNGAALLYREPELAVRVIREEFNADYRGVVIDDRRLYEEVHDYIGAFNPELADRVELYDPAGEGLPIYERFHIHEQLHKALDRKVWLPSGGSLIVEHTEALTVIDVNTGKNVGTSNLEETVFRNNLEAAEEVAKQLRLRDIGGIVVIDFIDMEIKENRKKVVDAFRAALARDKTRTQVFDISELGLVEMTRKRIGEGLLANFADQCPNCEGRGVIIDSALVD